MNEQALLLFAKNMIQNNRDRIPNTPWAQAAVNSIMNGDATAGAEIANNLCASNNPPINRSYIVPNPYTGQWLPNQGNCCNNSYGQNYNFG